MPEDLFKSMVKKGTYVAGLKYLKTKQSKGEKAANIVYESIELQDYLHASSNLELEVQRLIFSFRSRMNEIKSNFSRNKSLTSEFSLKICRNQLDNEHLTWCSKINK